MALRKPEPADVPATPSAIKQRLAADRLEAALFKANRAGYARALTTHAQALGTARIIRPRDVTDPTVLAGLKERARTSARSVTQTSVDARRRLIAQTGSRSTARAALRPWEQEHQARVAAFEAGMTTAAVARDFATRNADILRGEEWVEPGDSSGDAPCEDAIAQGRQPLGTIDPPPYHPSCVHSLSVAYDPVDDPSALWVGGADAEEDR